MAERYDFYVHDNRKVTFNLTEPIMREDSGVTDFVFHIPKVLNELEVSDWAWWLVFVNANKEKYSIALTLSDDPESPLEKNVATYTVDYAMSIKAGSVQFALEAINAGTGGAIDNEWHTQSYEIKVKETLQGNQAEYAEAESDIISALLEEVRTKVNSLVGGATPEVKDSIAEMTDHKKIYVLSTDGNWYRYNGTTWVSGGQYASGITIDPTLTQSGQAADAKVVGDKTLKSTGTIINASNYSTNGVTDANTVKSNTIYGFASNVTSNMVAHLPIYGTAGILISTCVLTPTTSTPQGTVNFQLYCKTTAGSEPLTFVRSRAGGNWTDWIELGKKTYPIEATSIVLNGSNTYGYTSLADLPTNKVYALANSITAEHLPDLPVYGYASELICYGYSTANETVACVQIFTTNQSTPAVYIRTKGSSAWGEWIDLTQKYYSIEPTDIILTGTNVSTYGYTSLADLPTNKVYALAGSITEEQLSDLPVYGYASELICYGYKKDNTAIACVQIFSTNTGPTAYIRTKGSSAWSAWKAIVNQGDMAQIGTQYYLNTCVQKPIALDSTKRVILFGDSITTKTGSDDVANDPHWWMEYVAEETGCTWTTYGKGSSAFVATGDSDQTGGVIVDQIKGVYGTIDWDCDLVVVAAGTNDAGFGYVTAEGTYMPLLKTAVADCITEIRKHTQAKIIFITPLRRNSGTSATASKIDERLPKVASMIANTALINGCSVINGFDFPITMETTEFYTRMTNYDGLHPNNIGKQVYARAFLNAVL